MGRRSHGVQGLVALAQVFLGLEQDDADHLAAVATGQQEPPRSDFFDSNGQDSDNVGPEGSHWNPGDVVVRREVLNDGRAWAETAVIVVADARGLLVTYIPEGAPFRFPPGDWPTTTFDLTDYPNEDE